jgi:hypothetical protein
MESMGRISLVYLEGTLSSKIFPPRKAGYFEMKCSLHGKNARYHGKHENKNILLML